MEYGTPQSPTPRGLSAAVSRKHPFLSRADLYESATRSDNIEDRQASNFAGLSGEPAHKADDNPVRPLEAAASGRYGHPLQDRPGEGVIWAGSGEFSDAITPTARVENYWPSAASGANLGSIAGLTSMTPKFPIPAATRSLWLSSLNPGATSSWHGDQVFRHFWPVAAGLLLVPLAVTPIVRRIALKYGLSIGPMIPETYGHPIPYSDGVASFRLAGRNPAGVLDRGPGALSP